MNITVIMVIVIIFIFILILYQSPKSHYAGPISHSFEARENYTSQPVRYRMKGYVKDAANDIMPINEMQEQADMAIVSTEPYYIYGDSDRYLSLLHVPPRDWIDYHRYNYIQPLNN